MNRLAAALLWLLATTGAAAGQVSHTAPYGVSDRGQVQGIVVGADGRGLSGRPVSIGFPDVPGGIGATTAVTDTGGRFSLELYVYGRGGNIPDPLDSLAAVIQVGAADGHQPPVHSRPVEVRFSPVGRSLAVTHVRVPVDPP